MKATANALITKTRAMFAKRLKDADYQSMMQKKQVSEIASYLKNETYYASSLDGVNEKSLHRGQLEALIRNDIIFKLGKILRYSTSKRAGIRKTIVLQAEINAILSVVRLLNADEMDTVLVKLPVIIENELCFDVKKLANVRTLEELSKVLENTPYHKIIGNYLTRDLDNLDYVNLEHDIYNYYHESTLEVVEESFKGKDRDKIEELIKTEIELDNVAKIYRLKKYFNYDNEKIATMITPVYSRFNKRDIEDMIAANDPETIYNYLKDSSYRNYLTEDRFLFIEHTTRNINYNMNRKHLMSSSDADAVLLTYIYLMGVEINNIVEIIEGVRYRVPIDEISKMLIY